MAIGKLVSLAVVGVNALELQWDDGRAGQVDLAGIIGSRSALKAIRPPKIFAKVELSNDGWSVEWPGGIDFGAPQLRRWMDEQAGEAMPAAEFRSWLEKNSLTLDGAAAALGLSRRMVAYYLSGEKAIPKTVLLATQGWQSRRLEAPRQKVLSEGRPSSGDALRKNEVRRVGVGSGGVRIIGRKAGTGELVSVGMTKKRPGTIVERLHKSGSENSPARKKK